MRTFDCIGDQRIYENFMSVVPINGRYKVIIDEGMEYEQSIETSTKKTLLEEWYKNYETRKMSQNILNILNMAIEDCEFGI
jgi:hypothetical protein